MKQKEWELEDDEKEFEYRGYLCEIWRHPNFGSLNGYVFIPRDHKYFGKDYSDLDHIDCHGGLTFSETRGDFTRIGFDCAHYGDYMPFNPIHFEDEVYRNMEYVEAECKKIVDQLVSL